MSICTCAGIQTGFDDVRFRIKRSSGQRGEYADWVIKPVVQETHIPGTNRTYREHLGFLPARVTWTLGFCCVDQFNALLARYGATGILTVRAGFQSLKGTQETLGNPPQVYEHLDNVQLLDIDDTPHFVGGQVETIVTFVRAVDPVTRLAVVA